MRCGHPLFVSRSDPGMKQVMDLKPTQKSASQTLPLEARRVGRTGSVSKCVALSKPCAKQYVSAAYCPQNLPQL